VKSSYDAILIVAFGGPENRDDVLPFIENVARGRNIPRERLLKVAEHYYRFDGISPLNQQVRELIAALRNELHRHQINLPLYWGNRNWHPLLLETLPQMAADGVKRALALILSPYSSYSSCRQYLENIEDAQQAAVAAPKVEKIRAFYNHPGFIASNTEHVGEALQKVPFERRQSAHVAYTAHSIPKSMANRCDYEKQLTETCQLVSEELNIQPTNWRLVYQSRSGPATDLWLEPDIVDHLRELKRSEVNDVVVAPIGFLSDHLEVLYDLDIEAQDVCDELNLHMVRAATVGTHSSFVDMLRALVEERISKMPQRRSVGHFGPSHDVCLADCCPALTKC